MPVMGLVIADESLHPIKVPLEPAGIAPVLLCDERSMLCYHGFVHIGVIDVRRLYLLRVALAVDHHGHIAVIRRRVSQVVEHATPLEVTCLSLVIVVALVGKDLSQCHIRQPGVPVPQHLVVLLAARCEVRIHQGAARRLPVHLLVILIDMLLDEHAVLLCALHLGIEEVRHEGQ